MERSHCFEVSTHSRHVQNHASTKAIPYCRCFFSIYGFMILQQLMGGIKSFTTGLHVLNHGVHESTRILWMGCGFSISIKVQCKSRVPELGKHFGSFPRVIIIPPPFVNNEHTRTLTLDAVIPGQHAFHFHTATGVTDFFSLYFSQCQIAPGDQYSHKNTFKHGSYLEIDELLSHYGTAIRGIRVGKLRQ